MLQVNLQTIYMHALWLCTSLLPPHFPHSPISFHFFVLLFLLLNFVFIPPLTFSIHFFVPFLFSASYPCLHSYYCPSIFGSSYFFSSLSFLISSFSFPSFFFPYLHPLQAYLIVMDCWWWIARSFFKTKV